MNFWLSILFGAVVFVWAGNMGVNVDTRVLAFAVIVAGGMAGMRD